MRDSLKGGNGIRRRVMVFPARESGMLKTPTCLAPVMGDLATAAAAPRNLMESPLMSLYGNLLIFPPLGTMPGS